jgi:two-component system sensor histidine kinase CiaH
MTAIFKRKRIRTIFIVYWLLLTYIIVALIYWFILLNQQNSKMTTYLLQLQKTKPVDEHRLGIIRYEHQRKKIQYLSEGITFLLLIITGAVFVFRVVRREFKHAQQQQNFMMAITHELKTPIAITKLNLETLQKHKLSEEQQQRLITNNLQEANRLNDLCNNILLASQLEAGGYQVTDENINLTELVQDCANEFIIRFPQRIIETSIQQDIYFTGDRILFQIAINNLLDNAIKYSPRESKVAIELKSREHFKIMLSVKDNGKGIRDEEKQKVFSKFYRVGNQHTKGAKGTGLGLFLTKKIVQQHHGDIIVADNQPQGSNIVISLRRDLANGKTNI